jgi:hypothetical protein
MRRSKIGITWPRRLMMPRTLAGALGSGVSRVQPRISRTLRMSMP